MREESSLVVEAKARLVVEEVMVRRRRRVEFIMVVSCFLSFMSAVVRTRT